MSYPSKTEFLEMFGIEPVEEDPRMAYCRYVKCSVDGAKQIDVSFSEVSQSFQVVFLFGNEELVRVSSESVRAIRLERDNIGARIDVEFGMRDLMSRAIVILEPHLHCHWWTLRA